MAAEILQQLQKMALQTIIEKAAGAPIVGASITGVLGGVTLSVWQGRCAVTEWNRISEDYSRKDLVSILL